MNVPAAKQMQETLGGKMKKSLPRWWKKRHTAVITEADPSCKVVYLGNVLTGWAKGNDRQPHTGVLQDVESLVIRRQVCRMGQQEVVQANYGNVLHICAFP